jgi:predicted Zn-dependent protease
MRHERFVGLLLGCLLSCSVSNAQDVVMQAMQHELQRSMKQLQLEDLSKPYFVSYTVRDQRVTRVSAGFGSLLSSREDVQRWLTVEVRVGSRALDNTNFFSLPGGQSGVLRTFFGRVRLPLEDDYGEIRRQLWLATDGAYKQALENLSKKRAALKSRTRSEELLDFSKEDPTTIEDDAAPLTVDRAEVEALVRGLSERFREMPEIHTSDVRFHAATVRTRYLNSEGSTFTRVVPSVGLVARAATQAADGLPLSDFVSAFGRGMNDLPSHEELEASIDRMGKRLAALREAPLLELYNGPVLFEGQAAAELFAQAFAPGFLAARKPVMEDPRMAGFLSRGRAGSLEDKIGARVLPRFLGVIDDPTRVVYGDSVLAGGYKVDDQGVGARSTKLIERGILKTLLADRTPVTGVERSTGNRRDGRVLPSNVVVTAERPLTPDELAEELQLLVQEREGEYGIVVRRMGNPDHRSSTDRSMNMIVIGAGGGDENPVEGSIEAYKVYADGREELIRNVRISGISAASFKDIVAASSESTVYTAPFSGGRGSPFSFATGQVPGATRSVVSWVVPSLLFEDLTLKKPSGEVPRPPVAEHPFFDRPAEK